MNEKKLRQLHILVLIMSAVAVVLAFVLSFGFKPNKQHKIETTDLKEFNDGWVLRNYNGENDTLIDLPTKLKADSDDIILIMHRVPEDVNADTVLTFETKFQNIQVFLGDEKIYENGVMNNQKIMRNTVPCVNVISLAGAQEGNVISIYMASGYDSYSGYIGSIYYGTKGDVVSWLVKDNGLSFVFSVALLVIVILLFVSMIFMKNVNVDKKKAGYAFAFLLVAALWTLLSNPLMQLITANSFGVYMVAMILLLLMPVLYLMYQRCFALKRRFARIFEIGIYIFGINFLTGIVFQLVGVCDFATYMVFTKILIVVGLILLSGIMYLAADTFSDKTIYSNLWANVVLTVACVIEAVLSLLKFYKAYDGIIFQIGLYLFMIMLVVTVEKSIISEMNSSTKKVIDKVELEKDNAIRNINTNFIFNSLAFAANNLKANNNQSYGKLIYDTSVYMQCNMNASTEKKLVPFSKELEYIKAYLGICQKRYPNVQIDIEDKVTSFYVPYNTVEPIIENVFEHGVLNSPADNGRLVVRSYERLDCFAIQIVDNGPGTHIEKVFTGTQSFATIKKRIKNGCGGVVEIKCKQGKGSIITVKIPKDGFIVMEE